MKGLALQLALTLTPSQGGGGGFTPPAYWYNYSPSNLTAAKAAKASLLAGTARMPVGIMGDSTTAGQGAGVAVVSSVNTDGAFDLSTTAAMRAAIVARGVPATKAEWGQHGVPARGGFTAQQAVNAYNPRVNYGNWTPGSDFSQKAVDNGPWVYTPAVGELCDTFEWMDLGTGGQSWTVTIGGAAPSATSGVTSYADTRKRTYSAASATTNPFAISLAGGSGYFYGVRAWNSAVKAVDLLNYGVLGYQAANFAASTGTFGHIDQMVATGMKLIYVNLGLNDAFFTSNPAVDSVTYGNNIESYTALFQAQSITVVLVFPPRRSDVSQATTELFRAEARRAATNKSCVLIDLYAKFGVDGGTTGANAAYYDDDVHMNAAGYTIIGTEYADLWAAI